MQEYSISIVRNYAMRITERPVVVRSRAGRFDVTSPIQGAVDIVISGENFRRLVIPGQQVVPCRPLDLGNLVVDTGIEVSGHVSDSTGRPVEGAIVLFAATHHPSPDPLVGLANGDLSTTSDEHGGYRIMGISATLLEGSRELHAQANALASHYMPAPKSNAVVDLVLLPTSDIVGALSNFRTEMTGMTVLAQPLLTKGAGALYSHLDEVGAFSIENVPVGDYEVTIVGQLGSSQVVHVIEGQSAQVSF